MTDSRQTGASDHVCWVYEAGDPDFDRAVRRFLAVGLERGERLLCVGERVMEGLRTDADGFRGAEQLIARGALETVTTAEAYDATSACGPGEQRSLYDEATRAAIADGYTGLRVVADLTGLAAASGAGVDLLQWEHLADQYIAGSGRFTALCAYRATVAAEALADAAATHPQVHSVGGLPPFQVFFDDGRVVLSGSIDTFGADRLARVLGSSPVDGSAAVLDLRLVDFVGVAGARAIARWGQELGDRSIDLEVRGASALFRRMWQVLALDRLAPARFADAVAAA